MAVWLDCFQRASAGGRHHEETTMPNDTDFTLSLFDHTALSGWNSDTLQTVTEPDETDPDDVENADQDGDAPAPSATPVIFHIVATALARGWPARDNIAAIFSVEIA
jgi:hypothetical protein